MSKEQNITETLNSVNLLHIPISENDVREIKHEARLIKEYLANNTEAALVTISVKLDEHSAKTLLYYEDWSHFKETGPEETQERWFYNQVNWDSSTNPSERPQQLTDEITPQLTEIRKAFLLAKELNVSFRVRLKSGDRRSELVVNNNYNLAPIYYSSKINQ
jgi:hypothetical protein